MVRYDKQWWALAVLRVMITLGFLPSVIEKIVAFHRWVGYFARWGYPSWFILVVGAAEVAGLVALWTQRWAQAGALLLIGVMLGATTTLALHQPGPSPATPLMFIGMLLTLLLVGGPPGEWRAAGAPIRR